MSVRRGCTKTACGRPAVATLTYNYADQIVVVGPLATYAEPHTYDLCREHAERLTVPRGWEVVRVGGELPDAPAESDDDLLAIADAIRPQPQRRAAPAAGRPAGQRPAQQDPRTQPGRVARSQEDPAARRSHLRLLRDE